MSRDIPIIFSAPMIRALLDGRKTMTRRLAMRSARKNESTGEGSRLTHVATEQEGVRKIISHQRPGPWQDVKAGDRLWCRESVQAVVDPEEFDAIKYLADGAVVRSTADTREEADRYADQLYGYRGRKNAPDKMTGVAVPSIHMPRWASRLTLVITATKVEPLHDISDDDCFAEGLEPFGEREEGRRIFHSPVPGHEHEGYRGADAFCELWSHLHGRASWDENPEVVALTATIHHCNIDKL